MSWSVQFWPPSMLTQGHGQLSHWSLHMLISAVLATFCHAICWLKATVSYHIEAGHRWIPPTKASDAELWLFFDLALNKRLSTQSRCRWFEMPLHSLWCHCNVLQCCVENRQWDVVYFNSLRLRQNGCHFADNIFKCIFLNETVWISINISLKFVPKGQINNIPALVQIMAWCRPGDKPLSEPMMLSLVKHTCITRPQWFNKSKLYAFAFLYHYPFVEHLFLLTFKH